MPQWNDKDKSLLERALPCYQRGDGILIMQLHPLYSLCAAPPPTQILVCAFKEKKTEQTNMMGRTWQAAFKLKHEIRNDL